MSLSQCGTIFCKPRIPLKRHFSKTGTSWTSRVGGQMRKLRTIWRRRLIDSILKPNANLRSAQRFSTISWMLWRRQVPKQYHCRTQGFVMRRIVVMAMARLRTAVSVQVQLGISVVGNLLVDYSTYAFINKLFVFSVLLLWTVCTCRLKFVNYSLCFSSYFGTGCYRLIVEKYVLAAPGCRAFYCTRTTERHILCQLLFQYVLLSFWKHTRFRLRHLVHFCHSEASVRLGLRYFAAGLVALKHKAHGRRSQLIRSAGYRFHRSILCSFEHLFYGSARWLAFGVCFRCAVPRPSEASASVCKGCLVKKSYGPELIEGILRLRRS